MDDFSDAARELKAQGAAQEVSGAADLAAWWEHMLADPDEAQRRGTAAREVARGYSQAAKAAAGRILEALERRGA